MIALCDCPEPPATGSDYPDDMHVHDGCRVYHKGARCAAAPDPSEKDEDRQSVLPL